MKYLITYNHDWRDISVKNPIFHTQDLCLCTLDTNLICKKNVCRNEDYYGKLF